MGALKRMIGDFRSKPELLPLVLLCSFASGFAAFTVYRNVFLRPDQSRHGRGLTNWELEQLNKGKHYDAVARMLEEQEGQPQAG